MSKTTTLVQMRLRDETIERVDRLKEVMETDNRTRVVAQAIRFTADVAEKLRTGSKLFVRSPDGEESELWVSGL